MRYDKRHVPLVVVAGKEYGAGSSRDWAAKATALLGIRSVIAENFERIHRNNLISMGIWPLEFTSGLTRRDLALDGSEELDILGLDCELKPTAGVTLVVRRGDGSSQAFQLIVKVDTQAALQSLRHGGVLPQTLRELEETTRRAGQSRMRSV